MEQQGVGQCKGGGALEQLQTCANGLNPRVATQAGVTKACVNGKWVLCGNAANQASVARARLNGKLGGKMGVKSNVKPRLNASTCEWEVGLVGMQQLKHM
eukprot:1140308-Pelagomonas_calceolata.AAC.3